MLAAKGGYTKRLVAAMIAANYLAQSPDPEYKKKYSGLDDIYKQEQQRISQKSRW